MKINPRVFFDIDIDGTRSKFAENAWDVYV